MKKSTKLIIALSSTATVLTAFSVLSEQTYRFVFHRKADPTKLSKKQITDANEQMIEEEREEAKEVVKHLDYEEFERINPRRKKLHAKLFPCGKPSKKFVICSHGYRSNGIDEFASIIPFYLENGINTFVIDHQAHGKSEGSTITFGLRESKDLLGWVHWLIEHFGQDIEIMIHGVSMGAASALETSSQVPEQVKFIVEDCGYTTIKQQILHTLKSVKVPTAVYGLLSGNFWLHTLSPLNKISPLEEVKQAKIPILFVHGMKDDLVPFTMGEELYDACPTEKDALFVVNAGHTQSYFMDRLAYENKIKEFIHRYMK